MTHRELYLHSLYAEIGLQFTEDDVALHVVPLFHVNGWGTPHFLTMVGGQHVMLRKFEPLALIQAIERHKVTRVLAVPAIFNAVLHHADRTKHDLSSLKQVIVGGAPSSPTLIAGLEEAFHCQAIVGYGLSETTPILTLATPRTFLTDSESAEKRQARQSWTGWPLLGIGMRVVHSDGRDVRPDGEQIGEIVVRSNTVMDGYFRDPDATAATIRDGWLHTGDMAVIDEQGYVLIKDRSKDIIIRGGENISSVEVEIAIASHPAVLECAVVSAPDRALGEAPVAIVVLKEGASATTKELREHCKGRLARFKVPRDIHFRDSLPKGGTGKILKAELREPFWKGHDARVQ
jgi:fatty-acyl-CoA synthase